MSTSKWRYWSNTGVRYVAKGRTAPANAIKPVTCGSCGRTWDDGKVTGWTPTPAGRCALEYLRGHGAT